MRCQTIRKSHVCICKKKIQRIIRINHFIMFSHILPSGMLLSLNFFPCLKSFDTSFFYIAKSFPIHYMSKSLITYERSLIK